MKYIIVDDESEKQEYKILIEECSGKKDLNISFFTSKEVREDIIGINHDEYDDPLIATDADIDEIFEKMKMDYDTKTETLYFKDDKSR